ncbi:radical SAM protein [Methylorubrum thiocyanatum]|uniref:radical SAM protein n=1 Tax=Methylorubrum thiocyanatum TaxID=47958 RepID=UPI003F7D966A
MFASESEKLSLVSGAISVTGACTIACKHCYSESGPNVSATHSIESLIEMIDALRSFGVQQVFVGGGEPFLHPDLHTLIAHMFKSGVLPSVSSNGHGITKQKIENLYTAGMRYNLAISLDGPNDMINGLIRGPKSFFATLQGMYELADFGDILWGVNYVCCQQNLGYALETAQLAKRLGASYFNCIKFTPSGRGERHRNTMEVSTEQYNAEILSVSKSFAPLGEYYDDIYVFDIRDRRDVEEKMVDCARSYFADFAFQNPLGISINHNGDVALAPPNIPLGNVKTVPIMQILERINSVDVLSKYHLWISGKWDGIHPAKSEINRPEVSYLIGQEGKNYVSQN